MPSGSKSAGPQTPSFDKLRIRFSTRPALSIVLTLSLSKGGDDAERQAKMSRRRDHPSGDEQG